MVYSRIFLFSLLCSFLQIAHAVCETKNILKYRLHINPLYNSDSYYRAEKQQVIADFNTYLANETYPDGTKSVYTNPRFINDNNIAYDGYLQKPDGSKYNYCSSYSKGYCTEYVTTKTFTEKVCNDCPPKDTIFSGAGLRKNGELFTPPSTICISKCLYDFSDATAAQEIRTDGSITTLFYGDAKSLAAQCPVDDQDDTPPPLNPCKQYDSKTDSYVEKDYCQKPDNVACPPGYVSGIFNAKNVCVKSKTNDQDNCTPTASDPYKCLPTKPQEPTDPDANNNCSEGTVQVLIGTTLKCATQEVPPDSEGHCPDNYVKQTFDGVSVCVPNNQRPDSNNNCPLNTSLVTLSDGSKVCRSVNGGDGSGASEPSTGTGDCNPETDFLCKDFELPTNNKLDVKDIDLPDINENKISWSQSCPADQTLTLMGKTFAFKYNDVCNFLSTYINPLMVAFGYLSGAFIIIGAVRK